MVICHGDMSWWYVTEICHARMSWVYVMTPALVSTRPTWHIPMTYPHDIHAWHILMTYSNDIPTCVMGICHRDTSYRYVIQVRHLYISSGYVIQICHLDISSRYVIDVHHTGMSFGYIIWIYHLGMSSLYIIQIILYTIEICHLDMSSRYVVYIYIIEKCHLNMSSRYAIYIRNYTQISNNYTPSYYYITFISSIIWANCVLYNFYTINQSCMEIAKRRRHNPPWIPSVSAPPILLFPFITGILVELVLCTSCGSVPAVSLCLWRSLRHWRCVVSSTQDRKTNELLASASAETDNLTDWPDRLKSSPMYPCTSLWPVKVVKSYVYFINVRGLHANAICVRD